MHNISKQKFKISFYSLKLDFELQDEDFSMAVDDKTSMKEDTEDFLVTAKTGNTTAGGLTDAYATYSFKDAMSSDIPPTPIQKSASDQVCID